MSNDSNRKSKQDDTKRDSTNEYFLNNERVRLKDITNLLILSLS